MSVERTVRDPEVEYLEEQHAVRYVYAYTENEPSGSDQDPLYETVSFEEWAGSKAATTGAIEVGEAVASRFERDSGVDVGKTHVDGERAVVVNKRFASESAPDGSRTTFDRLVSVTPRSITVTVDLDGESHTTTVGVWVRESVTSPV